MIQVGELNLSSGKRSEVVESECVKFVRHLGESLFHQGRYASALRCFEEMSPIEREGHPLVASRMAVCCSYLNRMEDAQCYFSQALAQDSIAQVHWDYAHHLLKNGYFEEGWRQYRLGRSVNHFTTPISLTENQMLWDGVYRPDSTLEIVCEVSISDQILFAAFFPELLSRAHTVGMRVVVNCDASLKGLFQSSFSRATIVPWELCSGRRHEQQFTVSNPYRLKVRQSDLPIYVSQPKRAAYLNPDEGEVRRIRSILANGQTHMRVGVVGGWVDEEWQSCDGGAAELSVVRAVLGCKHGSVRVFDLNAGREEIRRNGNVSSELRVEPGDMNSIAALMREMHVVVGVDSALANVSGALGCDTRVLLRGRAHWCWGREDRERSWYPYAKGYWERIAGGGSSPAEQLLADLVGMSAVNVSQ
ncbi:MULTISPECIES: tetratricopeptide repeat protein [Burkholderia]|uniref:tetratricopeptide repeat protein n=1 Tax=Burkholderia TaxID=32008 RepID=UPI0021513DE0|nr:tetratricopeptide repeat protein [Burkholderia glumae]